MASSTTDTPPSLYRDASFSSYLNSSEEKFIRNLVSSTQNLKTTNSSSRLKMKVGDEIDVFRADMYFNGDINRQSNLITSTYLHNNTRNHISKTVTSLSNMNLQPRTPSVYSEPSSNSQSVLLRPVLRNRSNCKTQRREKKSSFLSSCYCCDAKSIDIDEQDRLSNFRSRSFDNNSYDRGSMTRTIKTSFDTADITRLNKLKIDSKSDLFTFPVSYPLPTIGPQTDDAESDASSDLFELECLSCTGTPVAVTRESRNGSDAYEPSEASVDWSVVTASPADFTAFSDTEDQKSTLTSVTGAGMMGPEQGRIQGEAVWALAQPKVLLIPRSAPGPESRPAEKRTGSKCRGVGLFGGCRSQKAVRLAGDVYKVPAGRTKSVDKCRKQQRFSESYSPMTRYEMSPAQHSVHLRHSKTLSADYSIFSTFEM